MLLSSWPRENHVRMIRTMQPVTPVANVTPFVDHWDNVHPNIDAT